MPTWLESLGQATGGLAAGGVVQEGLGLLAQGIKNKQQVKQTARLNEVNSATAKHLADYNYGLEMKKWNETNYKAQVEQMKKAGINPGLLYGMSGGSGATAQTGGAQMSSGKADIAQAARGSEGMGLMVGQMGLLQAQKENIEADTRKKIIDANKAAGVDTKLANTQIESLTQGIKNQKAVEKLTEIQDSILRNELWEAYESQDDRIDTFKYEAKKKIGEARSAMANGEIDEKTINTKISLLKTELVARGLENVLTRAKTENTKADTKLKQEQASKTEQDRWVDRKLVSKWMQENEVNWMKLSLEERKVRIGELLKDKDLEMQGVDNILGVVEQMVDGILRERSMKKSK